MENTEVYYFSQQWLNGPVSFTEIAEMVAAGKLAANAPAWMQSGDAWIAAGFFADLARQTSNETPQIFVPDAETSATFRKLPPPRGVFALRLAFDQRLITQAQAARCLQEITESPKCGYDIPGRLHRLGWITAGQRSNLACLAESDGNQQIISGYEILGRLGSGGMGITYRARQISLDRIVALKVLLPRYCQDQEYTLRFLSEARLAAKLNHPAIATIYEVGASGNEYFMAMELVEGVTLAQHIHDIGRLSEREAAAIVLRIAEALQFAYENGIVHRDVSAKNIMLGKNGQPKLIDLGLAKNISSRKSDATEFAIGTPAYLSPEQAAGRANVDIRSDIYSLGCVFYEMLRGEPPFQGESALETIAMHLNRSIPELPADEVSEAVRHWVKKMTRRNAALRYQTPDELVGELRNFFMTPTERRRPAEPRSVLEQLRAWEGETCEVVLSGTEREYLHLISLEMTRQFEKARAAADFQGVAQTVFAELAANAFDHGVVHRKNGTVRIKLTFNEAFFRIEIADSGPGFAVEKTFKELRRAPAGRERQRGLLLVKQIADILEYNVAGNEVKAVLYRKVAGSGVFYTSGPEIARIEVRGNGDMALAEEFRRFVDNFAPSPVLPLLLQVRTDWVGSTFVGTIAKLASLMEEWGKPLAVCVEQGACRKIMEQLGIAALVDIYSSCASAEAALIKK